LICASCAIFPTRKIVLFTTRSTRLLPKTTYRRCRGAVRHRRAHAENAVTRAQRAGLVKLLKNLPIDPAALRPVEEAVVTRGGIATNEIDPKTMQSKLVHGLYFAGEIIDVDAVTAALICRLPFRQAMPRPSQPRMPCVFWVTLMNVEYTSAADLPSYASKCSE
jgi:hypothetical protein